MKPLYIRRRGFWLRRQLARLFRSSLAAAVTAVSLILTLILLTTMALHGSTAPQRVQTVNSDAGEQFDMRLTNRLSDALEGMLSIEKVYWLSDRDPAAPVPNPSAYGESTDPQVLQTLLGSASGLLESQSLYFAPDRALLPGSTVHYYLDETILALAWKEVHDNCVYTFAEIKIAHPSQIRRFLSGNAYGTAQQFLTTEMSQSVNAVVASSGDFYAHRPFGITVYGGEIYRSQAGNLDICFVDDAGDLQFLYADEVPDEAVLAQYVRSENIRFSLAFGPVIVDEGQAVSTGWYPVGENAQYYSRAALCQMGELHYLLAAANMENGYPAVPTLDMFARQLLETGCQKAYTLDGGQTAAIAMNHQLINQVSYGSQRRISDIIYFATAVPDGG